MTTLRQIQVLGLLCALTVLPGCERQMAQLLPTSTPLYSVNLAKAYSKATYFAGKRMHWALAQFAVVIDAVNLTGAAWAGPANSDSHKAARSGYPVVQSMMDAAARSERVELSGPPAPSASELDQGLGLDLESADADDQACSAAGAEDCLCF